MQSFYGTRGAFWRVFCLFVCLFVCWWLFPVLKNGVFSKFQHYWLPKSKNQMVFYWIYISDIIIFVGLGISWFWRWGSMIFCDIPDIPNKIWEQAWYALMFAKKCQVDWHQDSRKDKLRGGQFPGLRRRWRTGVREGWEHRWFVDWFVLSKANFLWMICEWARRRTHFFLPLGTDFFCFSGGSSFPMLEVVWPGVLLWRWITRWIGACGGHDLAQGSNHLYIYIIIYMNIGLSIMNANCKWFGTVASLKDVFPDPVFGGFFFW